MNSGVYVNYDKLSSIIEMLKSERQNLNSIFTDVKNDSNDMSRYWIGNTANHATQNMKDFTDSFDLICEQVERKMQENSSVSAI